MSAAASKTVEKVYHPIVTETECRKMESQVLPEKALTVQGNVAGDRYESMAGPKVVLDRNLALCLYRRSGDERFLEKIDLDQALLSLGDLLQGDAAAQTRAEPLAQAVLALSKEKQRLGSEPPWHSALKAILQPPQKTGFSVAKYLRSLPSEQELTAFNPLELSITLTTTRSPQAPFGDVHDEKTLTTLFHLALRKNQFGNALAVVKQMASLAPAPGELVWKSVQQLFTKMARHLDPKIKELSDAKKSRGYQALVIADLAERQYLQVLELEKQRTEAARKKSPPIPEGPLPGKIVDMKARILRREQIAISSLLVAVGTAVPGGVLVAEGFAKDRTDLDSAGRTGRRVGGGILLGVAAASVIVGISQFVAASRKKKQLRAEESRLAWGFGEFRLRF